MWISIPTSEITGNHSEKRKKNNLTENHQNKLSGTRFFHVLSMRGGSSYLFATSVTHLAVGCHWVIAT